MNNTRKSTQESNPKKQAEKQLEKEQLTLCDRCTRLNMSSVGVCKRYCPFCNKKYVTCEKHKRSYTPCKTRECKKPYFYYLSNDPRLRTHINKHLEYAIQQNEHRVNSFEFMENLNFWLGDYVG